MNLSSLMPGGKWKKLSRLLYITALSTCSVFAYAQRQQVRLTGSHLPLKSVFKQIEKQTDLSIDYKSQDVDDSRIVEQMPEATTVQQAMNQLLAGTGCVATFSNGHIILKKQTADAADRQSKPVKGTIVDAAGVPVIGANVVVKGTTNGTITDMDGNFSLDAPSGSTLLVSYVGYANQEIPVGNQKTFSITLKEDSEALDELVVVGYGTQKKVNLTGAVSTVNYAKEAESRALVDATQALGGVAPGLQVMQGTGNPNAEGFSINIRGLGTLNSSGPLILVDGMEQSLSQVNPADIESISVLKDAASCAIYGNRGANGVILITTKTAGKGKVNIDISTKLSLNTPMRVPELVNDYADYMELINESYTNLGRASEYTDATINLWREKARDPNGIAESGYPNYVAYPNTDWYDAVYDNSWMQDYTVQVSGSTDKSGYDFSFNYTDNDGILKTSEFKRFFIRSNIYGDIAEWLRVGSRIWGSNTDIIRICNPDFATIDYMQKVVPGMYPYYDGKYGGPETNEEDPVSINPVHKLMTYPGGKKNTQIFTNFYVSAKFLKHFSYDFGFWYKHRIYDEHYNSKAAPRWSFSQNEIMENAIDLKTATTGQTYQRENDWKFNHVLNYNQSFGKHDVSALAGFEEERFWSLTTSVMRRGMIDTSINDVNAGIKIEVGDGVSNEYTSRSWFGRITYAYDQRYLLEADIRRDGSSRFSPKNRWGTFPAVSAGWRISEEPFMANTRKWLGNLKLRASWGNLGNNSIGNYDWQQQYAMVDYPFNSTTNLGLANTAQANYNLKWEKTETTDVGLDFSVLNNRLSGIVDYYNKKTTGILYRPSIMGIYGNVSAALQNIAEVTNKGLEVQLTWSDRVRDFQYSISGNFSYNHNEVNKYKGKLVSGWETDENGNRTYVTNLGDVSTGSTTRVLEGHMINEHYMLRPYKGDQTYFNKDGSVNPAGGPRTGMIRTEDDMKWLNAMVDAGYTFYPNQTVGKSGIWYGDYIYADLNNDGIYGNTYDNDFTGSSSMPKWNFGMQLSASWKGFDLSMNWYGVAGNSLYFYRLAQNSSTTIKGYAIGRNVADDHYFYDPENPADPRTNLTSDNPRLTNNSGSSQSESTSTKWLYKGNFLKLKNITLGYAIPRPLVQKVYMQNARVFFSGENLLTITGYPGIDPEMRSTINYLTYRQFIFGLNVTF